MMPQDLHGAARDISVSSYDEQRSSNGVSMRESGEIYSLHRDAIFLSDLLLIYFPALDGPLEYQYDEIHGYTPDHRIHCNSLPSILA